MTQTIRKYVSKVHNQSTIFTKNLTIPGHRAAAHCKNRCMECRCRCTRSRWATRPSCNRHSTCPDSTPNTQRMSTSSSTARLQVSTVSFPISPPVMSKTQGGRTGSPFKATYSGPRLAQKNRGTRGRWRRCNSHLRRHNSTTAKWKEELRWNFTRPDSKGHCLDQMATA